jgi:hypothetical protein
LFLEKEFQRISEKYRKKKEGNRRKDTKKELEVPLESFKIDE